MKKNRIPKKPIGWIYYLAVLIMGAVMRVRFKLKVDRSAVKGIKGPVIAISNHQCNLDFVSAALTFFPLRFNFVVSTYFFNGNIPRFALGLAGAIPKKQFIPDIKTVRDISRAIGNKQSVYIFPEGQVGYYGTLVGIDSAIGKLVKHLKVPVVTVKLRGGFLSYGKWSRALYPARMEATGECLLTPDRIDGMSEKEIYETIREALSYNEFDWQRQHMVPSKKDRLTAGLENILYRCPACETDFTMTSVKNELHCSNCGYSVRLNRYAFFESPDNTPVLFDNITDWFLMQKAEITKEVENGLIPFVTRCRLMATRKGTMGYVPRGEGTLTLDFNGLFFEGIRDEQPFCMLFSVDTQTAVTHNTGVWGVDFASEDCNYAFCPDDPRKMIKLVELYTEIRNRREQL